jgi:hypothetical protein
MRGAFRTVVQLGLLIAAVVLSTRRTVHTAEVPATRDAEVTDPPHTERRGGWRRLVLASGVATTAVSVGLTAAAILCYEASLPGTPSPTEDWGAFQTYAPPGSQPHVSYRFDQSPEGFTWFDLTVELRGTEAPDDRRPRYVLVTLAESVIVDQFVADGDVLSAYTEPAGRSAGVDWRSQGVVLKTRCAYGPRSEECGPQVAHVSAPVRTSVIVRDGARYSVVVPVIHRTELCPRLADLDDESAARFANVRGAATACFGNPTAGEVDITVGPVPHALRIDDATPAPVVERGGAEIPNRLRWRAAEDATYPVANFVDLAEEAADQRRSVWAGVMFGVAAVVLPVGPQLVWHARPRRRPADR